jgi:N-acyl-D-amino-acid deacylase
MTGLPARTLGLTKRGRLAAGQAADVLVFDPTQIRERASYAHPQRPSEGMLWVFVGGRAAIANGKVTRARGGRLLLRHKN